MEKLSRDWGVQDQDVPSEAQQEKGWFGSIARVLVNFLVLMVVFGIPYSQEPLYTDNQNTKFLQGLAQAGLGQLQNDWLANTIDPLPAFTFLVRITYQVFGEYGFYLYALIAYGIYAYSLVAIAALLFNINRSLQRYLGFLVVFVSAHAMRLEIRDLNFRFHRHLHYGLADQYVLGHYFQPSLFGVLILLSIYVFLRHQPFRAVILLAIAATFHPAYLPSAAILTLAYMGILGWEQRSLWKPLGIGTVAFVGVFPVFLYMTWVFRPTTAELWQRSQDIIVNFRIPHHSLPELWLPTLSAVVQITMMVGALYVIRKTRLFWIMMLPFGTATILVLFQLVIGNDTLAFTAPWRVSAFLMPLSLTVLLAQGVNTLANRYGDRLKIPKRRLAGWGIALLTILVLGGVMNQTEEFINVDETDAMLSFVKTTYQPGETYMVPVRRDKFWLNEKLWRFRLLTGAPIVINAKSHPYKDVEVIDWFERVDRVSEFYDERPAERCDVLVNDLLPNYPITHVVMPNTRRDLECDRIEKIYEDTYYDVYSIVRNSP